MRGGETLSPWYLGARSWRAEQARHARQSATWGRRASPCRAKRVRYASRSRSRPVTPVGSGRMHMGRQPRIRANRTLNTSESLLMTWAGLHSGPSSCLGPSCPTPAAQGRTSTPRPLQSHRRPRKTPRPDGLGVRFGKASPSGGASGIQDGGRDLVAGCGVRCGQGPGWRGPIPSSTGGQDLSHRSRGDTPWQAPGGCELVPHSVHPAPTRAQARASSGVTPTPAGCALRAPTDDGMEPHHEPPFSRGIRPARVLPISSSRSTSTRTRSRTRSPSRRHTPRHY